MSVIDILVIVYVEIERKNKFWEENVLFINVLLVIIRYNMGVIENKKK